MRRVRQPSSHCHRPSVFLTYVAVNVDRSCVIVAPSKFVGVRRILVHPLLSAQLVAVVVKAAVVALLVHEVINALVNTPAESNSRHQ
eukprot:COSAG02_NODE_190_length_30025_cov_22.989875_28_plen_87_part_00